MTTDHIKMPDIAPLTRYIADGVKTIYNFPFPIFASEDLTISFDGARQASGFTVRGAGKTEGGTVTFDTAPATGTVIKLERRLPLERLTDFLEGGDFSARAINNELDFLLAAIQQVGYDQAGMLRYSADEAPANMVLPVKSQRAGKILGFDSGGNPVAISAEGSMAAPDFTASGTGAVTRSSSDKFSDLISVKDFGAIGDGITDDTAAIQKALSAHRAVFIPTGTYLVTAPLALGNHHYITGAGQGSIIKAATNAFHVIDVAASYTNITNLQIEGGAVGVNYQGGIAECVQNALSDVIIILSDIGIRLDGGGDPSKPCYWNNFSRILIERPQSHGVYLTLTGAGDTPNANRFNAVRVYSKGAPTSGSGFYVEYGALNNAFIDCEANMNGNTAESCFRIGAYAHKTLIVNLLTEGWNTLANVKLDAGSQETSIFNLSAQSDGAAIWDFSGGHYDAYNAGFPNKNRMRKTIVTDLTASLMRFDTEYIDTPGTVPLDLSHSIHIVDAGGGPITVELPRAADAAGVSMTVKKKDNTSHIVTITEAMGGSGGPDGAPLQLGGEDDYATMLSNGAAWLITNSNRMAGNTRFIDASGMVDIDMAVDTYLLSSFGGAMTARLPPANAAEAAGRTITLKKTDPSANVITVTEQGGAGPDQYGQPLSSQYEAITVTSNGGQWYIVSKFP